MKIVDLYLRVRQSVFVEGRSRRETARLFGIARKTVDKMCTFSVPPGYRRQSVPTRPKLDGFTAIIDQILADDQRMPHKQRHTAKRIWERLCDEYGFSGRYTIVKGYVHDRQLSIYQFRHTAQSGGRGKHNRMSLMMRRSPRVNHEVLLRATFLG